MFNSENRFLLYIDILGFSEMVKNNKRKVRELYYIINHLNAHRHKDFKTIIFSDTILVHNINCALNECEENYYVIYLIEFAKDLFYRLSSKGIFFRAFIVQEEFEFEELQNFQQYFGKALIKAYNAEKNFPYIGLFIDNKSNTHHPGFKTIKIDNKYSFVFINQPLVDLYETFDAFYFSKEYFDQTGITNYIAADILYLKNLNKILNNKNDKVVEKVTNTLGIYRKQFPEFYAFCIKNNFNIRVLGNNLSERFIFNYFNSGSKILPKQEIRKIIKKAYRIGKKAAKAEIDSELNNSQYFHPCGWIKLVMIIDIHSYLFKILKELETDSRLNFYISKYDKQGYAISFNELHQSQSILVNKVAYIAIKKYLEKEFDIPLYIQEIYD